MDRQSCGQTRLGHVCAHVVVGGELSDTTGSQLRVVSLTPGDAEDCARLDWAAYAHLRHIWDPDAPAEQSKESLAESTAHIRDNLGKVSRAWGHRRLHDGKLVSCVHFYHALPSGHGTGHGRVAGMLVDPEHRRQGLARRLMDVLLPEAPGVTISLLSTKMGRDLYAGLGFHWLDSYANFFSPRAEELGKTAAAADIKSSWPGLTPAEAAKLARAAGGVASVTYSPGPEVIAEIVALDSEMFGGDRSDLLQSSFARAKAGILVVLRETAGRKQGQVIGFGFSADAGRWGRSLAPLVASSTDSALAIVGALAALESVQHSGLRMTLRLNQTLFVERLREMGFEETAPDSPMPGNST